MSDLETMARPYAKAIFELAGEQNNLAYWSDILQLAASIAADDGMQNLIVSPAISAASLAETFTSVMSAVKNAPEMTTEVKNMIALLAENGRLPILPALQVGYEDLKQAAEGTVEVMVTSANELTAGQEKKMAKNLKSRLGKEVNITTEINPSLIAGAIIRAGDLVIDGSARGRLNKLTTLLNK